MEAEAEMRGEGGGRTRGNGRRTYLDLSDVLVGPGRVADDEHVARAERLTAFAPCVLGTRSSISVLVGV